MSDNEDTIEVTSDELRKGIAAILREVVPNQIRCIAEKQVGKMEWGVVHT